VTNETWEHFWLNEGMCVFVELKIIKAVYGQEEMVLQMSSRLKSLAESVNHFGKDHNFTRLIPDLSGGGDPDDAFSTVPYIKGMSLFCLLEDKVGGPAKFEPFLPAYFSHFAGKTVNSNSMRDFFFDFFKGQAEKDAEIAAALAGPLAALDWDRLFFAPGMPDWLPVCDAAPVEEAKALADRWNLADSPEKLAAFSKKDIEGWSTTKLIVTLDALLSDSEDGGGSLSAAACERMAECYGLLEANCELRFRFLRLALGAKWDGARASAVDLATCQGRMKFTRPMFRALKDFDAKLARETFDKHRTSYHPICSKMVARDLDA